VVIESTGLTLFDNEVDFAPAATQEPWPVGFYERVYKDRKQDPATAQALDRVAQAAKTITSYHLRVRDSYSWGEEIEEIYYVPPDKLRIDTYQSDKLTETILSDGHTLWDYKVFLKSATKLDLEPLQKESPDSWLTFVRERTRFDPTFADLYLPSAAYLGTEEMDGEGTCVFSGVPIRGAISDAVSMKIWVSPQDGRWRKIEYYTTTGKAFLTKTVLEAETDVTIPEGLDINNESR
jgi:outer membrane lipoprotein-sorting protein